MGIRALKDVTRAIPAGLWRDLIHAGRSLAKARAFTFVCVVSLGIGMTPVIAIPYVSQLTTLTPPGVNTEELVQLVTTSVGPRGQTEQWSYPDYLDLRDANTGITLIGWTGGQSEITFRGGRNEDAGVDDVRAGELLQDARRGVGAGSRVPHVSGRPAGRRTRRHPELHVLAEPSRRRSRHRRQDAHDGWHPACRRGCGAGSVWGSHRA